MECIKSCNQNVLAVNCTGWVALLTEVFTAYVKFSETKGTIFANKVEL